LKVKRTQNVKYYLAGTVALITFIVYLPVLQNDFIRSWDDAAYIIENVHIRSLNPALFKWSFFDFYESNWHPLAWISHAADYAFWGLNPMGHHLTNIILHALNAAVAVLLVIGLLETARARAPRNGLPAFLNERTILIAGGTTGLLFGLHPLHVESAAWVAERKDLLCALFFLLSVIMYTKYVSGADDEGINNRASRFFNKRYLAALGLFILALLSKPMAVTLTVVLLMLDWYPFNRIQSFKTFLSALIEKLPFIALSLISSILTILAQRAGGAIQSTEVAPAPTRLLVAARSLIAYLWKMIWPVNLVPYYPYPKNPSLLSLGYLLPIVLVIGITIACLMTVKKRKLWLSVWCYYFTTLLPVLGIVQVGGQSMADRYTYLPSLGPFLIMGLGTAWISKKINAVKSRGLIIKGFSVVTAVLVVAALSSLTVRQIGIWKNSINLWSRVIEKDPERVPMAYYYRGAVFEKRGQYAQAIEDYARAIELYPSYTEAYSNRGAVFEKIGQFDKAIDDYNRATALNPSYYMAYNNKGTLYGKEGLFDRALESFNQTIAINPDFADAYYNRGLTYVYMGRYGNALEDYNKAILLNQNDATFYLDRGKLYLVTGKHELAMADFRKACDLGNKDGCNALP
jgi:Tfp pilus assembly protein PilF